MPDDFLLLFVLVVNNMAILLGANKDSLVVRTCSYRSSRGNDRGGCIANKESRWKGGGVIHTYLYIVAVRTI